MRPTTTKPVRSSPRPPPERFRAEVLAAIEAAGLTNHSLAKESGVATSVVTRFINGNNDLSMSNLERLAGPLNLRLVAVTTRAATRSRTSPPPKRKP